MSLGGSLSDLYLSVSCTHFLLINPFVSSLFCQAFFPTIYPFITLSCLVLRTSKAAQQCNQQSVLIHFSVTLLLSLDHFRAVTRTSKVSRFCPNYLLLHNHVLMLLDPVVNACQSVRISKVNRYSGFLEPPVPLNVKVHLKLLVLCANKRC